jgi:hypothetical protein
VVGKSSRGPLQSTTGQYRLKLKVEIANAAKACMETEMSFKVLHCAKSVRHAIKKREREKVALAAVIVGQWCGARTV